MTIAREIREIAAEQGAGPAEQRALESVATALDGVLEREVPYRPEFRAQLRQELLLHGRRRLTPWYRRPALWGGASVVAAAAVVLFVGLQHYRGPQTPEGPGVAQQEPPTTMPAPGDAIQGGDPGRDPHLVSRVKLPVVDLPDELVVDGNLEPESMAGLDLIGGLKVVQLIVRPDLAQFRRIAIGLGFAQEALPGEGQPWEVTEGSRHLALSADGRATYEDSDLLNESDPVIDLDGASLAARRFLDRASLPVPSLQPDVTLGSLADGVHSYTVTYTPRLDGRPVVNALAVIQMTDQGRIIWADAFVEAGEEPLGTRPVRTPAEALSEAEGRGGARFGEAFDLVYARVVSGDAVYLLPYFRFFGNDGQSTQVLRYVAALAD